MTSALIIIDVQQALCSGPTKAFESERVIERINLLSTRARSAGVPVIIIQHETDNGPFQHGSPGWQLAKSLLHDRQDIFLRKKATDSFHNTALQSVLQQNGVSTLVICGLQSDFCVDTTTRRALALGYPVTLVSDGHSTIDNGVLSAAQISAHHTVTLANIQSFGPRVTPKLASEIDFS